MQKVERFAVNVCTAVAKYHGRAFDSRKRRSKCGTGYAFDSADFHIRADKNGSRGTRGHKARRVVVACEKFETFDKRTVFFCFYCGGRHVVVGDNVGCVHDFHSFRVVTLTVQHGKDFILVAHENDFQTAFCVERVDGAKYGFDGRIVAAECIDDNFHKPSLLCAIGYGICADVNRQYRAVYKKRATTSLSVRRIYYFSAFCATTSLPL